MIWHLIVKPIWYLFLALLGEERCDRISAWSDRVMHSRTFDRWFMIIALGVVPAATAIFVVGALVVRP